MNFESTVTTESASLPGVKFTVKRLSNIERAKRDLTITEHSLRFSDALSKIRALQGETDDKGVPISPLSDADAKQVATLDYEAGLVLNAYLKPAIIRGSLLSVEGFEIEGKPADIDTIMRVAPDEFIDEVWIACQAAAGLTGAQSKNSSSPSDSGGPAAGQTSSTIAEPVAA